MGLTLNLREDLNALTPRLRRYARALLSGHPGGGERADDLVHATLLRAMGARNVGNHSDLVVRLYATLTQLNRDTLTSPKTAQGSLPSPGGVAAALCLGTTSPSRSPAPTVGFGRPRLAYQRQ